MSSSFLAWGYNDGSDTPTQQTGRLMLVGEDGGIIYNVDSISVKDPAGNLVKPGTPVINSVSAKNSSVSLSWSSAKYANGYEIYRADTEKGPYNKMATVKDNRWTDTDTAVGKTYRYRIRACVDAGQSKIYGDYSTAAAASIPVPYAKPAAPSISLKKSGSRSIKISWKKVKGASGYQIYRASKKKGKYKKIKTITKGSTRRYTNKKLKKERDITIKQELTKR